MRADAGSGPSLPETPPGTTSFPGPQGISIAYEGWAESCVWSLAARVSFLPPFTACITPEQNMLCDSQLLAV